MSRAQLTSTVEQNTGGAVAPFVAGKNKIINGDFGIWQRGISFSSPATGSYLADRFYIGFDGSPTTSYSRQTFTPGTAPVSGYESSYFMRCAMTAVSTTTSWGFYQRIEDVRTLAGQTVTISFWAKADSSRTGNTNFLQEFGSGGSSTVFGGAGQNIALTTSWQRFTYSLTLPSISGKTIGTNSSLTWYFTMPISTTSTIDIWGVQVEAGSVATPFTTATGTLSGELTACQRYFYIKNGANGASGTSEMIGLGTFYSSTIFRCPLQFPVQMRTAPSFVSANSANYFQILGNSTNNQYSTVTLDYSTPTACDLNVTVSGATGGQSAWLQTNSGSAFLQFSAEL